MIRAVPVCLLFCSGLAGLTAQSADSSRIYFERGLYDEVIRFGASFPADSISTPSLSVVAKSYFYKGQNRESQSLYALLARRPDRKKLDLVDYALLLCEMAEYDKGDSVLSEAFGGAAMDSVTTAKAHNARGILHMRRSNWNRALQEFRVAGRFSRDPGFLSFVRSNEGIVFRNTGQYRRALAAYREALATDSLARREGDVAADLLNIANVFYDLGRYDDAEATLYRSEDAYRRAGDSAGLMLAIGNRAAVLQKTERFARAQPLLQMSIQYSALQGDPLGEISLTQELAYSEFRQGRAREAAELLTRVVDLARQLESSSDELSALLLLSQVCTRMRDFSRAHALLAQALEVGRLKHAGLTWMVMYELGRLHEQKNDRMQAARWYEQSIRELETQKGHAFPEEALPYFFQGQRLSVYRALIRLRLAQDRIDEAFQISERLRGGDMPVEDRSGNTAMPVLSYVVEDSAVHVFIRLKDTLAAIRLGETQRIRRAVLEEAIRMRSTQRQTTAEVFDLLVRPTLTFLSPDAPVAIVPDDFLFALAFESLFDGERYWIERNPVCYTPAVRLAPRLPTRSVEFDTLRIFCTSDYGRGLAAWQLEDLPYAEQEGREIYAVWRGPKTIQINEVDEAVVQNGMSMPQSILHLSGHGLRTSGGGTAIVMQASATHDGYFQATDIQRASVRSSIVFLSACATEDVSNPTTADALSRAMMAGGAKAIIGTRWEVNDRDHARLVLDFYANLAAGHDILQALRSAKIAMIRAGIPRRHWAGTALWMAN